MNLILRFNALFYNRYLATISLFLNMIVIYLHLDISLCEAFDISKLLNIIMHFKHFKHYCNCKNIVCEKLDILL